MYGPNNTINLSFDNGSRTGRSIKTGGFNYPSLGESEKLGINTGTYSAGVDSL